MKTETISTAVEKHTALLCDLIRTPSFSGEENGTAEILLDFLAAENIIAERKGNNIIARNRFFDRDKKSILLNSHHDTVKPAAGWQSDPFEPIMEAGRLTGLGSNDAGASLVSLMAAFLHFYDAPDLKYNIILAATAEEENSGRNGIESIYESLGEIVFAIVGEPTQMQMAVAEKGLLVLDVCVEGKSGHAARNEGINAIYEALPLIDWFRNYRFGKISPWLGETKMTVTQIQSGTQHNVVPAECRFTVDIRITEQYTHEEVLAIVSEQTKARIAPRSMRLRSSGIGHDHELVKAAKNLGIGLFGSPTMSDQALIAAPSVKIGPGDSARSHTADEFILEAEIENGISTYIQLLHQIFQ